MKIRPYRAKRSESDIPVNGKLALTPSKMMKLAEKGIPISSQNLGNRYFEGETNPSWDVPLDRQRGVDVNDMWLHNQNVKKKIKQASKDAIKSDRNDRKDVSH